MSDARAEMFIQATVIQRLLRSPLPPGEALSFLPLPPGEGWGEGIKKGRFVTVRGVWMSDLEVGNRGGEFSNVLGRGGAPAPQQQRCGRFHLRSSSCR